MSKHLVSITDASSSIGLGHVMRQLTLSQYVKNLGWKLTWLSASSQVKNIALVNSIDHILLPSLDAAYKELGDNTDIIVDVHQRDLTSLNLNPSFPRCVTLVSDIGYDYPKFGEHIVLHSAQGPENPGWEVARRPLPREVPGLRRGLGWHPPPQWKLSPLFP